ncbi:MAG: short-chain dehydrogenase [Alphaproteobacteria bacterium]|nr:MAG: short-chain dehydrogenase [Alphaproteobacteria bacterium]
MVDFDGKVAVVTGAASGIGRALAERFAAEGMRLVLADIEPAPLQAAAEALRATGAPVEWWVTDVADAAAVEALAETAYGRFGAVHVLCNNAGIVPGGRFRPIWEFAPEDWAWTMGVNLMGIVHGTASFVPRMRATGEWGHVVNTISVAGLFGGANSPVYSVSKHAALRATEALHAALTEENSPIGVTALCPGVVRTGIGTSERNRPQALRPVGQATRDSDAMRQAAAAVTTAGLEPETVAGMVVEAIRERRFYLITTAAFDSAIRTRMEDILARRNPTPVDLLALSKGDVGARG